MSPSSKFEGFVATKTDVESLRSSSDPKLDKKAQKPKSHVQKVHHSATSGGFKRSETSRFGITLLVIMLALSIESVQSGFWTFYMPNLLKPSGYKELTDLMNIVQREMNRTKDNYADIEHFWRLLEEIDSEPEVTASGQESSVCDQVLPMFRELASEYTQIDYKYFITPLELHFDYLNKLRDKFYPEGPAGKTILPREWEQNIYENELELKVEYHKILTETERFKSMRQQMVDIWTSVKRGLDNSLKCLYLSYAYRQVAEDINQLALDMNLDIMQETLSVLGDAYSRIAKYKESDAKAIAKINESIQRFQPGATKHKA